MSATIIDGKAYAAGLERPHRRGGGRPLPAEASTPGLAVVLVGEDPASQIYVRNKARQTVEAGMRSFEHALPATTGEAELLGLGGPAQRRSGGARHPRAAAAAAADRRPEGDRGDRSGQGRGRVSSDQRRPAADRRAGLRALHAARLPAARSGPCARTSPGSSGGGRPLQHRRQADGAAPPRPRTAPSRWPIPGRATSPDVCRRADILVAAVGGRKWCAGDWIKPGAIVIDVGINRVPNPAAGEGGPGSSATWLSRRPRGSRPPSRRSRAASVR